MERLIWLTSLIPLRAVVSIVSLLKRFLMITLFIVI